MDLKTVVGNAATVCTVGLFFTGVQICMKIWRRRSTSDISAFPFISGFISAVLWLQYGLFVKDSSVIAVNIIGAILQTAYLLCYYFFTTVKNVIHKQLAATTCILLLFSIYLTYFVEDNKTASNLSGFAACGAVLIFFASPLITLAEVIKTKSVESLPFLLILSSFIVSVLWVLYGVLINDTFIQVPNFLGVLLAGFQLTLFAIYPSKKFKSEITFVE